MTTTDQPRSDTEVRAACLPKATLDAIKRGAFDEEEASAAYEHIAVCGSCEAALYEGTSAMSAGGSVKVTASDLLGHENDPIVGKHTVRVFRFLGPRDKGYPDDLGTFGLNSRYRVLAHIETGGMAEVFEAYDKRHNARVALKVLKTDEAVTDDKRRQAEGDRERFRQEARSSFAIRQGNDRVVVVIDSECDHDPPYIVAELISGKTLRQRLREAKNNRLGAREAARILYQVAEGLGGIHEQGWVHQDIKPENVMLPYGGAAKIIDAGSAFEIGGGRGTPRSSTKGYASPERIANQSVGKPSDVFSLGVLLVELTTGAIPERCNDHFSEAGCPEECERKGLLAKSLQKVPRGLRGICQKCLRNKPSDRYQDAGEVHTVIGRFLTRPRRVAYGVIGIVVLLTMVGTGWFYFDSRSESQRANAAEQTLQTLRADIDAVEASLAESLARDGWTAEGGLRDIQGGIHVKIPTRPQSDETRRLADQLNQLLSQLAKIQPNDPTDRNRRMIGEAQAAQAKGDPEKVFASLPADEVERFSASAREKSAQAYQMNVIRGAALAATEKWLEAEAALREALRHKPNDPYSVWLLLRCSIALNRGSEYGAIINPAIAYYEALAVSWPASARNDRWLAALYQQRATWHLVAKRYPDALEDIDRAIAIGTRLRQAKIDMLNAADFANAQTFRCIVLVELGRLEESLKCASIALGELPFVICDRPKNYYLMLKCISVSLKSAEPRLPSETASTARFWRLFAYALMAHIALQCGDLEAAERDIAPAVELVEATDDGERTGLPCLVNVVRFVIAEHRHNVEIYSARPDKGAILNARVEMGNAAIQINQFSRPAQVDSRNPLFLQISAHLLFSKVRSGMSQAWSGPVLDPKSLPLSYPVEILCRAIRSAVIVRCPATHTLADHQAAQGELREIVETHGMSEALDLYEHFKKHPRTK